jgi:DNA polymerase III sliding clamp (beta) subunit (PCNA family)
MKTELKISVLKEIAKRLLAVTDTNSFRQYATWAKIEVTENSIIFTAADGFGLLEIKVDTDNNPVKFITYVKVAQLKSIASIKITKKDIFKLAEISEKEISFVTSVISQKVDCEYISSYPNTAAIIKSEFTFHRKESDFMRINAKYLISDAIKNLDSLEMQFSTDGTLVKLSQQLIAYSVIYIFTGSKLN